MSEFGQNVLADSLVQMSTEERIVHSLTHPNSPYAMVHGRVDKLTISRIRYALSELLALNLPLMQRCLERVAETHPKEAILLMMELMQFTLPKQKAASLNVNANADFGNPRERSLAELQQMVVSEQ